MSAEPSPDWILKLSQEIQSQMNWELTELKTSVSKQADRASDDPTTSASSEWLEQL